jgi:heme-degrading monooxygenase HmoA
MATIGTDRSVLTLVNVFTVAPENQHELVDLLRKATESTMRHLPGFISATIHRSLDGAKVVNYAQWRSREDFAALMSHPEAVTHMKAAAVLASFDPILCEVVESIGVG